MLTNVHTHGNRKMLFPKMSADKLGAKTLQVFLCIRLLMNAAIKTVLVTFQTLLIFNFGSLLSFNNSSLSINPRVLVV